jgi:hypothetical protein
MSGGKWVAEQARRRKEYVDACAEIGRIWEQRIACSGGLLPGSVLDAILTPRGWCGQVQLSLDVSHRQHVKDVRPLTERIAEVYDIPRAALLVESGAAALADTAFIWAFLRPSMADHHQQLPHSVTRPALLPRSTYGKHWQFGKDRLGESAPSDHLTRAERDSLHEWTSKYVTTWEYWRSGPSPAADIDDLVRRMERMRGAILDALPRVGAKAVVAILLDAGMTYEAMPHELAQTLGWQPSRHA